MRRGVGSCRSRSCIVHWNLQREFATLWLCTSSTLEIPQVWNTRLRHSDAFPPQREYCIVAFNIYQLQVMFKEENRWKRWSGLFQRRSSSFWLMRLISAPLPALSKQHIISRHSQMNAWIFCVHLPRSIKAVFIRKTLSLSPTRGFCSKWELLFQTQWRWHHFTQPPKASSQSKSPELSKLLGYNLDSNQWKELMC